MKNKKLFWLIPAGIFLVAALVTGIWLIMDHMERKAAEDLYQQLAQQNTVSSPVQESSTPEEVVPTAPQEEVKVDVLAQRGIEIPEKEIDFAALQAETNADIYAWIYIPGTRIDYPVLQHPTDDSYYLDYNIDGSKGYPGCIYTELCNSKDFTDPHTVLYGHNMKNGTMFAGLHNYRDADYLAEHPYIYIYTPDKTYVYEIFGAYEFSAVHLIRNFDLANPDIFQIYLDGVFEIRDMGANILSDIEVDKEDRIVTLSTCIKTKPNQRYLVQGVLLNP